MSPLDIAELSLVEASRWQREALALPKRGLNAPTKYRRWRVEMLLRRGVLIKADQIAHSVGCSIRTVYRDIAALRADGMRIYGEAGVGYLARR